MKHQNKVRLARSMRSKNEFDHNISIFSTEAWKMRKRARSLSEARKRNNKA